MAAPTKNFDPRKFTVVWANHVFTGFTSDGVSVALNSETGSVEVGMYGDATRILNADKSGRITLNLQASSSDNDKMSEVLAVQRLAGTGDAHPLLVTDLNGTTALSSPAAWIVGVPEVAVGSSPGARVWVLEAGELNMFVGGMSDV